MDNYSGLAGRTPTMSNPASYTLGHPISTLTALRAHLQRDALTLQRRRRARRERVQPIQRQRRRARDGDMHRDRIKKLQRDRKLRPSRSKDAGSVHITKDGARRAGRCARGKSALPTAPPPTRLPPSTPTSPRAAPPHPRPLRAPDRPLLPPRARRRSPPH